MTREPRLKISIAVDDKWTLLCVNACRINRIRSIYSEDCEMEQSPTPQNSDDLDYSQNCTYGSQ